MSHKNEKRCINMHHLSVLGVFLLGNSVFTQNTQKNIENNKNGSTQFGFELDQQFIQSRSHF